MTWPRARLGELTELLSHGQVSRDAKARETRGRMRDLVRSAPGLTLDEIRARLGIGWSALYLHLEALEKLGELCVVQAGRRRIVVPKTRDWPVEYASAVGLLRGPTVRAVGRVILSGEARTPAQVAALTNMSPRTACYHIRHLVLAGLVESSNKSRYFALRPSPLLRAILADVDFEDPDTTAGPSPPGGA